MAARAGVLAFLVLLSGVPFSGPAGAAQEPLPFEILDDAGDVKVSEWDGSGRTTYPPNPLTDAVDLRSLRVIAEDAQQFTIELRVVDLGTWWTSRSFVSGGVGYELAFSWQVPDGDIRYKLEGRPYGSSNGQTGSSPPASGIKMTTTFCIYGKYSGGTNEGCGNGQSAQSYLWVDEDRATFIVPKLSLLGLNKISEYYGYGVALPPNMPKIIDAGAAINFTRVSARSFNPSARDEMPDPGKSPGAFHFAKSAANTKVRITLLNPPKPREGDYGMPIPGDNNTTVAVSVGEASLIPLKVANNMEGKRLVNITASFLDPSAGNRWSVQVAPTLEIPGRDFRVVNLVINSSSAVRHRETVRLVVDAVSLAHEDELAQLYLVIQATQPISVERNRLFLHAIKGDGSSYFYHSYARRAWLNTEEMDPDGSGDEATYSARYEEYVGDTPLAKDLFLNVSQPVRATLQLLSSSPMSAQITFHLFVGDVALGSDTRTYDLTTTPAPFDFEFALEERHHRILTTAGAPRLDLQVKPMSGSPGIEGLGEGQVGLRPKGSVVALPVMADPRPVIIEGPRLLGLSVKGDSEDFVNPGRAALFEVVLVNEGKDPDQATLNWSVDHEDWDFWIEPAIRYNLLAGESITFAVFARARERAIEGEQFHARIHAASSRDPRQQPFVRLQLTVLPGDGIPDEAFGYRADPDAVAKGERDPAHKSPGAPIAVALVAVAALVLLRRRRP